MQNALTKARATGDQAKVDLELKLLMLQSDVLQTREQCLAIADDLQRRSQTFKQFHLQCRDGRCRRRKRCVGEDLRCVRDCPPQPASKKERRRLKRDFRRAPTKW